MNGPGSPSWPPSGSARPYVRWWWLNGPFRAEDVEPQLRWFASQGFGGVELAWLDPGWYGEFHVDRPAWLDVEWSRLVGHTKRVAESLGLGCDFTFGSVWPFGGTCVPPEDAEHTLDGPSGGVVSGGWEEPRRGPILDHLSSGALHRYFDALLPAFREGIAGTPSALFCDSFEGDKHRIFSPALWDVFEKRCGYSLREHVDNLPSDPGVLYDWRKVVGEAMVREFYAAFAAKCRLAGAVARVQCHGAPVDLLAAYSAVDVPESETLLFPPTFSRIPASAAALSGREVVSCETFTCLHGFPRGPAMLTALRAWKKERVLDLKLLADAVFANGVNQIVWHGAPYNPPGGRNEFYAAVHVGPDSPFVSDLPSFNAYLARVSALLREGRTCSRLAVYLPNEDMMLAGDLPRADCVPGAVDYWEMRTVRLSYGTEGFAPIWISGPFLSAAEIHDGELAVGPMRIPALLVDVSWLDSESLAHILRLAKDGLPTALVRRPRQPGRMTDTAYESRIDELVALPNVVKSLRHLPVEPLVQGSDLPWFWAREKDGEFLFFFAHPAARKIRYPMPQGAGEASGAETRRVTIHAGGVRQDVTLSFTPARSIALRVGASGVREEEIPRVGEVRA